MTERRAFPVTPRPAAGTERRGHRGAPRALLPIAASSLDRASEVPLFRQLFIAIRQAILEGSLRPDTRLPSTRTLAVDLGVARNTVLAAFEQLTAEGYLESRVGAGTRVASIEGRERGRRAPAGPRSETDLSTRGRRLGTRSPSALVTTSAAFQPGLPDLARFPHALWARLLARHARNPPREILTYNDTGGLAALQSAIAAYLGAARGVRCESDQVVVFGGGQAALDLVARMVTDPGDPVWIEDPAYGGARVALTAARAELVPVPVDEGGFDVRAAIDRDPSARAAYVTPSSQYPLGHTMSLARRLRLLEWANQYDAWIIEDDYDSEYRFRDRPLTALHGIDEYDRVIYLGTFSKGDELWYDFCNLLFLLIYWRRGRDSNPRWAFNPYSLSRGAPSAARPPLRETRSIQKRGSPAKRGCRADSRPTGPARRRRAGCGAGPAAVSTRRRTRRPPARRSAPFCGPGSARRFRGGELPPPWGRRFRSGPGCPSLRVPSPRRRRRSSATRRFFW